MTYTLWSEENFLRPAEASSDAWQKILSNFYNYIIDPVEDLPTELDDVKDRLEAMGLTAPSNVASVKFILEQAGDFGSIVERSHSGAMGQGWSSLADIKLVVAEREWL